MCCVLFHLRVPISWLIFKKYVMQNFGDFNMGKIIFINILSYEKVITSNENKLTVNKMAYKRLPKEYVDYDMIYLAGALKR